MSLSNAQDFSSNQKVYSTIGIDGDFADDRVLVVLNKQETMKFRNHTVEDFIGLGIAAVQNLSRESTELLITNQHSSMNINLDEFRTILCLILEQPNKENVLDTIKILEQREDILSAGVDFFLHSDTVPNDDMYHQQWALHGTHGIQAAQAWTIANGTASHPVRVGIIDSGIQADHSDLNVNIALSRDFTLPYPYIPANVTDNNGHGTHVAGIVGAIGNNIIGITGVNWNIELVSLRINQIGQNLLASHLIKAVDFASANGISILNNSNGTSDFKGSNSDVNAVTTAINQYPGLFITSAGNENMDNDSNNKRFPSNIRLPNIITVGATNNNGLRASYSNYGANNVCIYAPGGDNPSGNTAHGILSTYPTNKSSNVGVPGYYSDSGTSMATPMLTGAASLLLSANPDLTPIDLKNIIRNNADKIIISTSSGNRQAFRLNAFKALSYTIADVQLESAPIVEVRSWGTRNQSYRLVGVPSVNDFSIDLGSGLKPVPTEVKVAFHFDIQAFQFTNIPRPFKTFLSPNTWDFVSNYETIWGYLAYPTYHCITEYVDFNRCT